MKKLLSIIFILCFVLTLAACGENPVYTEPTETSSQTEATQGTTAEDNPPVIVKSDVFDETKIVFSFGAISDVHIANANSADTANQKFLKALNQLKAKALENDEDGLDAVLSVGDMIDTKTDDQMRRYVQSYRSVFDPLEVPNINCYGHYHEVTWSSLKTDTDIRRFINTFGEDFYKYDVEPDLIYTGNRHAVVNGYHILALEPSSCEPTNFSKDTKAWLDETLAALTAENPNQYVFLICHAMMAGTCYGSDLGPYWASSDITDILSKYPQVVIFGGHLHFPLNDERSIMQTGFTALGDGAVNYMAIEDGGYEDMSGKTTMKDKTEFSQGLLVQVDENGNVRITRMDFYHDDTIEEPWEISYPTADGSNLKKYSKARADKNTAPVVEPFDIKLERKGIGATATMTFKKGTDDEFVHHYLITIYKDGEEFKTFKILADFYKHPHIADMKDEWVKSLGILKFGSTYKITLQAFDSWDAASNIVEYEFECNSDTIPEDHSGDLPDAYADFDFDETGIKDAAGHVSVTNHGAEVKEMTLTLGMYEGTINALCTEAGKYVSCKFDELDTKDKFIEWAQSGFSVEATFTIGKHTYIQGIVCGTQDGGWGLAVNKDNHPYFITGNGTSKNAYKSSIPTALMDETELMHVVCVYDYQTRSQCIYINGKLASETALGDGFFPGIGDTFNLFCLGDDVKVGGEGGDFPSTGKMVMTDAKIYSSALNSAQVENAYKNAQKTLR